MTIAIKHDVMFTLQQQYLLSMEWWMYGILFLLLSASLDCFRPRTSCSRNSYRQVPGLATDFLVIFGALDEAIAACTVVHF